MSDVAILGGGISGLASAYFLSKKGLSSTIIEMQPRLGGLIKTDLLHGCQLEAGPDSYLAAKPDVTELASELPELSNQIVSTNDEARRIFLVRNGELMPLPDGMVMMVPGNIRSALRSTLFDDPAKRAILKERFYKPRERQQDVSIAEFVLDHFDRSILEYIAEPLLAGVYGGDAGQLSTASVLPRFLDYERKYGSLIRAIRIERKQPASVERAGLFLSFRGGMQSLTDSLVRASACAVTRVEGEATRLEQTVGRWRIHVGKSSAEARFVIVCLPAHRAARLFAKSLSTLSQELSAIPYSSAISVNLVYKRESFGHPLDGFGFLTPRAERRGVAAATWINTKFPERIPQHLVALRAFIVDQDAETLIPESDEEILAAAQNEFSRLMGIDAAPIAHTIHRWPLSMPQYVVGHSARCSRIRAVVTSQPGLFLVGNAYDGIGVPDCVRLARRAVEEIEL
ncbi:MAG: protoporphyrinogen oxidase [Bryobacteraceae bacterium]